MQILLFCTAKPGETCDSVVKEVLPSLALLEHEVQVAAYDVRALLSPSTPDVVLVDARTELAAARGTCRLLRATGLRARLIAVFTEAGLAALSAEWGADDFVLTTAGPAEVAARLNLAASLGGTPGNATSERVIRAGDLVIEPATYAVRIKGRPLDLTYKEFELLRYLAEYPGRVFTRVQLLREVWGYDYFGGTRTVDVHVRRLRAKLGSEHETLIGTVRHVGYRLTLPPPPQLLDHNDRVSV
ncbi:MAG: GlnR family transcriptional regulator [Acidimicrobiales bacterium]|nr:MAG: GlnR family transcriptional regulator [Acidimicrobiales bacterium]